MNTVISNSFPKSTKQPIFFIDFRRIFGRVEELENQHANIGCAVLPDQILISFFVRSANFVICQIWQH